ncbi:MAG: hypothetical protein H7276_21625 [Caulobacter sp.]|jgi:hypothetical protein|nr:hypothetical protein [Vitreoscilla sp.]
MSDKHDKERSEVPEPAAVLSGGVRIEALAWGRARGLDQNGGYIAAYDAITDNEAWLLKVYDIVYDDKRETDKQDLFIEELTLEPSGLLRVTDERGRVYRVDLRERAVVKGQGPGSEGA